MCNQLACFQLNRLECSGSSGVPVKLTRTHHTTALPTALAACSTANCLQACRVGVPVSPWTSAGLHDWRSAASRWTSRSTPPTVIIDLGTGCIPRTRLWTISDRTFPIAAVRTWNSLPPEVTSSRTLSSLKSELKTYLCNLSFPHSDSVKWLRCCWTMHLKFYIIWYHALFRVVKTAHSFWPVNRDCSEATEVVVFTSPFCASRLKMSTFCLTSLNFIDSTVNCVDLG